MTACNSQGHRQSRHLTVFLGGKPFTGIDPGLGPHSSRGLVPLVLDGKRRVVMLDSASGVGAMIDTLLDGGAEH